MKEVLKSDLIEDDKILKCICKNKDKILDAVKHFHIKPDKIFKITEVTNHMKEIQIHINNCKVKIIKRASTLFDSFIHITQIPSINTLSEILIIPEIGINMTHFESCRQLISWAGLAPTNNESVNKKKSVRIFKAD